MKLATIKKLQSFVGTIATVLTVLGKQGFTDPQFSDYFTGLIESIDEDGIFIAHPLTGEKGFFALQHVVGVVKEQVMDPDNPEHAKIIEELKKAPPTEQKSQVIPVTNPPKKNEPVDIDFLRNLVYEQQTQKKMVRKE